MISQDEFRRRAASFPSDYGQDFNGFWKWKIAIETNGSANILDGKHINETHDRLCPILSAWQTYRGGNNSLWRETLKDSLSSISEIYGKLRNYTLLDFESIPIEIIEKAWHELGRVKEENGKINRYGYYSIISITKPLLLMWGQTLAFDSRVREHLPANYRLSKFFCSWNMNDWVRIMKQFSKNLNADEKSVKFMQRETENMYGKNAIVPYGRFLDIYYWVSS